MLVAEEGHFLDHAYSVISNKAHINELALTILPVINFEYGPVKETISAPMEMYNTGSIPLK